jgi:glycosyltransferase involved in cell wall biosynthesis
MAAIVPTFNRLSTFPNHVGSLLHQTLDPRLYEIIILDNNSNGARREALHSYLKLLLHNVLCVFEPRQGPHLV